MNSVIFALFFTVISIGLIGCNSSSSTNGNDNKSSNTPEGRYIKTGCVACTSYRGMAYYQQRKSTIDLHNDCEIAQSPVAISDMDSFSLDFAIKATLRESGIPVLVERGDNGNSCIGFN